MGDTATDKRDSLDVDIRPLQQIQHGNHIIDTRAGTHIGLSAASFFLQMQIIFA